MKFYSQVLNSQQKKFLKNLARVKKFPFYLAGGTALALQLGHRTSLDFDFYSASKFDNYKLAEIFKKTFLKKILIPSKMPENTFQAKIFNVNLSVFYYPYRLIKPLIDFPPIKLASTQDIAAMKIAAIVQRAKQRDFFDLYYLIENLGSKKIVEATYQKYPWYEENNQIVFKALTYFAEADQDQEIKRITIFDKNLRWEIIKRKIKKEVEKFIKADSKGKL